MKNIRIGTMVRAGANSGNYIREIIPYGFECFALTYPSGSYQGVSPEEVAEKVMPELEGKDIEISSISVFGNPLMDTELAEETARSGLPCVMLGSIIHNRDVVDRLGDRIRVTSLGDGITLKGKAQKLEIFLLDGISES